MHKHKGHMRLISKQNKSEKEQAIYVHNFQMYHGLNSSLTFGFKRN
jgi:hypothetical protein